MFLMKRDVFLFIAYGSLADSFVTLYDSARGRGDLPDSCIRR